MSFYIDEQNRRKSPLALAAFGAALLDLCVFCVLSFVLAEPLYRTVAFDSGVVTTTVHALIIAALGTALCCLLFLLRDKRVVPYGFAVLAVILCLFYTAALSLEDTAARGGTLRLISLFGLAPVLLGNAGSWPVYLQMKRADPALNHRKTIQQELREAVEKEDARSRRKPEKAAAAPAPAAPEEVPEAPQVTPEEALFGPGAGQTSAAFHSAQEEAMLFYEDDEESDH